MAVARDAWEGFAGRGGSREFGRRSWERAVMATDWTRVLIEARGLHVRRGHTPAGDDLTCGDCVRDVLLVRNWPGEGGEVFAPESFASPATSGGRNLDSGPANPSFAAPATSRETAPEPAPQRRTWTCRYPVLDTSETR